MNSIVFLTFVLLSLIQPVWSFQYEEELFFDDMGEGILTLSGMYPKSSSGRVLTLSADSLASQFEKVPGIRVLECRNIVDGDQAGITMKLQFDSFEGLSRLSEIGGFAGFIGQFSFMETVGKKREFRRVVDLSKGVFGHIVSEESPAASGSYNTHFPAAVIAANTASENIRHNENTIHWSFRNRFQNTGHFVMSAEIANPVRNRYYSILLLGCAIAIILTMVVFSRK